ncbi:MAG: hypothetical protein RR211_08045, partial [Pseudoflavonifractor sp.]
PKRGLNIMRKEIILPGIAVAGGIGGFFLRRWVLVSAFEPGTGLPIPGAPAAWALLCLSAGVLLALLLLARGTHRTFSGGYRQAFAAKGNTVCLGTTLLAALLSAVAGPLLVINAASALSAQLLTLYGRSRIQILLGMLPQFLLALLCLATCVGTAVSGWNRHRGKAPERYSLSPLLPAYLMCLWLISAYQKWAIDPVHLNYIYELFAIIAAVLAFYLMAGFSFDRPRVTLTTLFSLLAVYFSITALADPHPGPTVLLYLFVIVSLLTSTTVLLFNDHGPHMPEKEEIKPEVSQDEG